MDIEKLQICTKVAEALQKQEQVLATLTTLQNTLAKNTSDTFSMGYPGTSISLDRSVVKVLLLLQRDTELAKLAELQETFNNL